MTKLTKQIKNMDYVGRLQDLKYTYRPDIRD